MKSGCLGSSLHGTYMHAMHHLLSSIIWGVLRTCLLMKKSWGFLFFPSTYTVWFHH
jgi:hypothetical protein